MRHLLTTCILAVLLAGCATLPEGEAPLRPVRERIAAFALDGRIAVRQDENRHSANIAWRHTPLDDDILLATPLGQGVAQLSRDGRGARLVRVDKEPVEGSDWEDLSARVFGVALPLSGLPRWLVGDVAPTRRDARGRPQAARSDGWEIRYLDYESDAPGALPVLIEFRRDDIELRLKVDTWQLD